MYLTRIARMSRSLLTLNRDREYATLKRMLLLNRTDTVLDAGSGVMVSTSVFQDRAGVEESNRQAADWVRQNMAPLLPNPPQITAGEVVAHTAK